MTTLADLNRLWPADSNAMRWVATPDGSWTRVAGAGVNPNTSPSDKEGRQNVPADPIDPETAFRDSLPSVSSTAPSNARH